MKTLLEILLSGVAVLIASYVLPGVSVDSFLTALWVALLLALANATIGLVLHILTIPLNFLTLGLVSFVINVCMVLLVDAFVDGFHTAGFISAAWFAIALGALKIIFNWLKPEKKY
ncbi:MAG: phage holin family protein [Sphingobacteriaceae bacterium]